MLRLKLEGRKTGRAKRRLMVSVKECMKLVGVREGDTEDRVRRRQMIGCGKRSVFGGL